MQIFIKTLSCGTIALDVQPTDSIETVRRKLRLKLDSVFEGYDTERLVQQEGVHGLIYEGKQLEDGKTLSDYNLVVGTRDCDCAIAVV